MKILVGIFTDGNSVVGVFRKTIFASNFTSRYFKQPSLFDVWFVWFRQLDLMTDLLGVNACSIDDFTGAVDPARRYLRRKLSSLKSRATPGSRPRSLLCGLLPPDHNNQHLLTRLLVFSPVSALIQSCVNNYYIIIIINICEACDMSVMKLYKKDAENEHWTARVAVWTLCFPFQYCKVIWHFTLFCF